MFRAFELGESPAYSLQGGGFEVYGWSDVSLASHSA